jgi:hypothetical protein
MLNYGIFSANPLGCPCSVNIFLYGSLIFFVNRFGQNIFSLLIKILSTASSTGLFHITVNPIIDWGSEKIICCGCIYDFLIMIMEIHIDVHLQCKDDLNPVLLW